MVKVLGGGRLKTEQPVSAQAAVDVARSANRLLRRLFAAVLLHLSPRGWRYKRELRRFRAHGRRVHLPVLREPRLFDSGTVQEVTYRSVEVHFATRIVIDSGIRRLVDVGSYVSWYPALASIVDELTVVDVRPIRATVPMFRSEIGTMEMLAFPDDSVDAVSSLSVIEHVGLGRYGDPIGFEAHRTAARELQRVVRPSGHIILATLVGKPCVLFNAGRVFSLEELGGMFDQCDVRERLVFDFHTLEPMTLRQLEWIPLGSYADCCLHLVKRRNSPRVG